MAIIINLDVMLAKRKMSVTELSERFGITIANPETSWSTGLKNEVADKQKTTRLDGLFACLFYSTICSVVTSYVSP